MEYGFDDEIKKEEVTAEGTVVVMEEKKKRKPFAYWRVGGRDYKLKLNTATIVRLEEKFKRNLLDVMGDEKTMPPLAVMLTITQAAMKEWEHGIKYEDVQKLFDRYCDEGGTQLTFMLDVFMEIYKVSGFFSQSQTEAMDNKIEDVKEML